MVKSKYRSMFVSVSPARAASSPLWPRIGEAVETTARHGSSPRANLTPVVVSKNGSYLLLAELLSLSSPTRSALATSPNRPVSCECLKLGYTVSSAILAAGRVRGIFELARLRACTRVKSAARHISRPCFFRLSKRTVRIWGQSM